MFNPPAPFGKCTFKECLDCHTPLIVNKGVLGLRRTYSKYPYCLQCWDSHHKDPSLIWWIGGAKERPPKTPTT